jgi:uncharacterized protein YecE (DUF72 family)
MAQVRIGCCGWTYPHWKGVFYPPDVRQKDRLAWYAGRFDTCEIDGSFYRLPSAATVAAWASQTPADFCFAWKVSRFISHNRKLANCRDSVELVFGRMDALGDKEGPALVQLPPLLHRDLDRLSRFAAWLPEGRRCAVEFRHPSWYDAAVFERLAAHNLALCISDHEDAPAPCEVTADFVYVRGHGPRGSYSGRYEPSALQAWAARIDAWRDGGRDVFCYFDNDVSGAAPLDAQQLKALTASS